VTITLLNDGPQTLLFMCMVCDQKITLPSTQPEFVQFDDRKEAIMRVGRRVFRGHIDDCGSQGLVDMDTARRRMTVVVNSFVESDDPVRERVRLSAMFADVMDTDQMLERFTVVGFAAPFVIVDRKSDGKRGVLTFQHHPRFYFNWDDDIEKEGNP